VKKAKLPAATLDEANSIVGLIDRRLLFYRDPGGRLRVRLSHNDGTSETLPCILQSDHRWPVWDSHRIDQGGTGAMVFAQLVCWIRGDPRINISWWAQAVERGLARGNGDTLLQRLRASTYAAGGATNCVLCGSEKTGDWWSLDGITGPACRWGDCACRPPIGGTAK
jgi:hypothetical protein